MVLAMETEDLDTPLPPKLAAMVAKGELPDEEFSEAELESLTTPAKIPARKNTRPPVSAKSSFFTPRAQSAPSAIAGLSRRKADSKAATTKTASTKDKIDNELPIAADTPIIAVKTKSSLPTTDDANTQPIIDHNFWPKSLTYLYLRDKPLPNAVKDFCKMQDVDVVLSDKLNQSTTRIHRSFEKEYPSDVWTQLVKAYGLMWFYDGFILYAYESGEIQTKILKIHPQQIPPLLDTVQKLRFCGSNMSIHPMKEGGILVINGAPKMIELLEDMTSHMEFYRNIDVDTLEVRIFQLKHAWADDKTVGDLTIPGVATLINDILGNTMSEASGPVGNSAQAHKIESLKDKEKDKSSDKKRESETDKNNAANEGVPEGGYVTTDARQNAIIVKDFHSKMPQYEELIAKLDIPLELIEIQAAIVNVNKSCGLTLGANSIKFGIGNSMRKIELQPLSKIDSNNSFSASLAGIVNGKEFLSTINFLESKNLSKVLARPTVITMDNMSALMSNGTTYYLPVQGHKGGDLYSIQGLTALQVTPHIIRQPDSTRIQLLLSIKDEKTSPGQGKDDKPSVDSTSITTQAVVMEGQSVLIGGYFQEAYHKDHSGIPILQNIPVLGNLFKNSSRNSGINERLFLITPNIIEVSAGDQYEGLFQTPSQLFTPAERIDNSDVRSLMEKTIDAELEEEELDMLQDIADYDKIISDYEEEPPLSRLR